MGVEVEGWDRRSPLIIDPTVSWSSCLGGAGEDLGSGIAVDGSGNAYVIGTTNSPNFPVTSGSYDTSFNSITDAFIAKLATGGTPDIRQPIDAIDFGSVSVGNYSELDTTIYNDGNASLTVNATTRTSGSTDFTYLDPSVPFSISAGGSQSVTVRFAPTSLGASSAVFSVNSDDPDEPDVTFGAAN